MEDLQIAALRTYIQQRRPLNLPADCTITNLGGRNHAHYLIGDEHDGIVFRLVKNNYRKLDWILLEEEFSILAALAQVNLTPKPLFLEREHFTQPILMERYMPDLVPFSALKPLEPHHIHAAGSAIASWNGMTDRISSRVIRSQRWKQFSKSAYLMRAAVWYSRLYKLAKQRLQPDALFWASELTTLVKRALPHMLNAWISLVKRTPLFHFDGAHHGNVQWDTTIRRAMFLDIQSVSWRKTPAFMLARFVVSLLPDGSVPEEYYRYAVDSYMESAGAWLNCSRTQFEQFLHAEIVFYQIADAIYVAWDALRRAEVRPLEQSTNIRARFACAKAALDAHSSS